MMQEKYERKSFSVSWSENYGKLETYRNVCVRVRENWREGTNIGRKELHAQKYLRQIWRVEAQAPFILHIREFRKHFNSIDVKIGMFSHLMQSTKN